MILFGRLAWPQSAPEGHVLTIAPLGGPVPLCRYLADPNLVSTQMMGVLIVAELRPLIAVTRLI